jgi:hypothetical protein
MFTDWRSWPVYKKLLPLYVFAWKRGRRLRLFLSRTIKVWLIPRRKKSSRDEVIAVLSRFTPLRSNLELERVGSRHDGGYLIPKDLSGVSALYSPGVGDNVEFDLEIASKGIPVFLADNSVDFTTSGHPLIKFRKKHLGLEESDSQITLDAWIDSDGSSLEGTDLMLQMDIEGAEWNILRSQRAETLNKFKVIVVEIHELQKVFAKSGLEEVSSWLDRVTANHRIVNTHINNGEIEVFHLGVHIPPIVELVLLRNDANFSLEEETLLPHPQEAANDPDFKANSRRFWERA